jgi:hypothetical protein
MGAVGVYGQAEKIESAKTNPLNAGERRDFVIEGMAVALAHSHPPVVALASKPSRKPCPPAPSVASERSNEIGSWRYCGSAKTNPLNRGE